MTYLIAHMIWNTNTRIEEVNWNVLNTSAVNKARTAIIGILKTICKGALTNVANRT